MRAIAVEYMRRGIRCGDMIITITGIGRDDGGRCQVASIAMHGFGWSLGLLIEVTTSRLGSRSWGL